MPTFAEDHKRRATIEKSYSLEPAGGCVPVRRGAAGADVLPRPVPREARSRAALRARLQGQELSASLGFEAGRSGQLPRCTASRAHAGASVRSAPRWEAVRSTTRRVVGSSTRSRNIAALQLHTSKSIDMRSTASNYTCYSDAGGAYCWTGSYWNAVYCTPLALCPNGTCDTGAGESSWNCPQDCGHHAEMASATGTRTALAARKTAVVDRSAAMGSVKLVRHRRNATANRTAPTRIHRHSAGKSRATPGAGRVGDNLARTVGLAEAQPRWRAALA